MLRIVLWLAGAAVVLLAVLALTRGMQPGAPPETAPAEAQAPAAEEAATPAAAVAPAPVVVTPPAPADAAPPPEIDPQVEDDAAATGMTTLEPTDAPKPQKAEEPPT